MAITVHKNDTIDYKRLYLQQERHIVVPVGAGSKAGATAGWTVAAAADNNRATCAAGSTAATLVVPIWGLQVGDTITGASLVGQVESAGNTATVALDLRKMTAAAADHSDASLGTDASGNITADTVLSSDNVGFSGIAAVVAEGETFYALVTATTAASTDVVLTAVVVTVNSMR